MFKSIQLFDTYKELNIILIVLNLLKKLVIQPQQAQLQKGLQLSLCNGSFWFDCLFELTD